MAYKYEQLESSSYIRILDLRDQVDGDLDFLQCSIEHVEISVAKFSAISYAWGCPKKLFRMQVTNHNGEKNGYLPLTQSLHNALRDLCGCDDIQPKRFWVDQICIN